MAAAFVMGLAISGMHYTAMAAAKFAPGAMCAANGAFSMDSEPLGYLLAGVSVALLGTALALPRTLRVPVPSLP
jgi:NO-binding membrane sensor protein with MHYT domain